MKKLLSYCLVLMYAFQLCFASGIIAQAEDENPVLVNEKFNYADGTTASAIEGFTFSGAGSAVVDEEADGNKALLLSATSTAGSTVTVGFDQTTSTKFKVSFKMKWVTHESTTVQNWFGSVRSGDTALLRTRHIYGSCLVAYNGTSNKSFVSCVSGETDYKKVMYIVDTETQSSQIFVDGVQCESTWGFNNSGTSADNLIFDLMKGSSVYLDDIYVENLGPLKKVDESFDYDAGTKASVINGFTFLGSGSAVVAEEADGNKALHISSASNSDALTLSFADTTSNKVKVSFKAKWVTHNTSTGGTYLFGAVRNGSTTLLKIRDYSSMLGYFLVGGAENNASLSGAISTEDYVEMSYVLDMNGGYSSIYVNGTQAGNYVGTKWHFMNTASTANNLYFQFKSGSEVYLDDFKVENVKLAVENTTPADKTENVDINSGITVKFNDSITAEHLTSEYFALDCNGESVDASAYTITENNGLVTIMPTNSWSYKSDYTVTVSKAVNTGCAGYITMDEDYSFGFKTADFENVTEYVYDFESYNENDVPSLTDGLGWSITAPTGSSAYVAVDEETNSKVLQLNSLDVNKVIAKLTFPYVDGDIIDISYDFKAPNHSANANDPGFGSVMNGNTIVTKGWLYMGSLIYWGHMGDPGRNLTVTSIADEWKTVKQSIDLKNNKIMMQVNGTDAAGNPRALQNSVDGVNALYFSAFKNAYTPDNGTANDGTESNIGVYYIDNIKVKSVNYPKVVSISPSNGSEKIDIDNDIIITFDSPMDKNTLSLIKVYADGELLDSSAYTITAVNDKIVNIAIADMQYSTTYKVVVDGLKTSAGEILTMRESAESEFKTKISGVNVEYTSIFFTDTITATLEAEDSYIESGFHALLAQYGSKGELLGCKVYASENAENNAIEMSIDRHADAVKSKIFVWEGTNSMKPVSETEILSEPQRQATIMNNVCADRLSDLITSTDLTEAEYEVAADNYVAQYLKETNIGRMLYNINYSRSCVTSDYMDSLYYNISFDENGDPEKDENGEIIRVINPESTSNTILNTLRTMEEKGIDVYEMAINATHKYHAEAWLSFRMADHHSLSDETYNSKYHIELCGTGYKNYNNEKLRNNYKRYILEMAERYDIDGVELDWLRSPGIAIAKETSMQFMRDIRAGLDEIGKAKGKEIKISVRLLPEVYQNENAGLYAADWVNEGLVDTVVAMNWYNPTNYTLDLASWREAIDSANVNGNEYELLGGMDYGVGCNGKNLWITPEHMKGFTSYIYNEGSDGVYMFNNCFIGSGYASVFEIDAYGNVTEKLRVADKWKAVESQASAETGLRRHLYSEPTSDTFYQTKKIYPLAVSSASSQTVTLNTGTKPSDGYYVVALGIKGDDGYDTDNITLTVNGTEATQIGDTPRSTSYPYKEGVAQMSHMTQCGERVMQFKVNLNSVNTGDNTFVISGTDENTKNIVWFEVFIDTSKGAVPVEAAN